MSDSTEQVATAAPSSTSTTAVRSTGTSLVAPVATQPNIVIEVGPRMGAPDEALAPADATANAIDETITETTDSPAAVAVPATAAPTPTTTAVPATTAPATPAPRVTAAPVTTAAAPTTTSAPATTAAPAPTTTAAPTTTTTTTPTTTTTEAPAPPTTVAARVEPVAGSCDSVAQNRTGRELDLVDYRRTAEFEVFICSERQQPGRLWYHGNKIDSSPGSGSITLRTERTSNGYIADNGGWVYEVRSDRVVLTSPSGRTALDQEFV